MLSKKNYTSEYISTLQKKTGADPSILERTVYAFGLLEANQQHPQHQSIGICLHDKIIFDVTGNRFIYREHRMMDG